MDKSRLTAMDQKVMEEMDEDVDYLDSMYIYIYIIIYYHK